METTHTTPETKKETLVNTELLKKKLAVLEQHPIVLIALVVMIGVSIFQSYQLIELKDALGNGGIQPAAASSVTPAVPDSLNNLPDMVGGC